VKRLRAPLLALMLFSLIASLISTTSGRDLVRDEAMNAGKPAADFPEADEDYYASMDGGVTLTSDQVKGRDTWMVWSAGDDAFWDYLANHSFGALDLLKTVTSEPSLPWKGRSERFHYLGLVNEPGFRQASGPDPQRFGLWLDTRTGPPDPFENAVKYPGVNGGSAYGMASGVVGLRLFPNPAFDEKAKKHWDPVRYYSDSKYYEDKNLVRPYRVGMTCAFCHVSYDPVRPADDPENPKWSNLSSYIGNQYFWVGRIFNYARQPQSFIWQLFQAPDPGSLDTSLISSDSINNPRTMNAIFEVGPRLRTALRYGTEKLAGPELSNAQLKTLDGEQYYIEPDTVRTPHILKDGSDSAGVLAALNRVYVNIGEFHEDWIRHFVPLVGGPETAFSIDNARRNSTYWNATEARATNMALFFLKAAKPYHLADAPGGRAYLTSDPQLLTEGKLVFADTCMTCHSSKQPPTSIADGSPEAIDWRRKEVVKDDFLDHNYLSTDRRYPVTTIGTNACSAVASNAVRGHVWDNFSSETYKQLPSVGPITVQNPMTGSAYQWTPPGGGRGYVRVPSLISIWATAPFFQNNALGKFVNDPSVAGRMESFDDSVEQLLWPEKRVPRMYRTSDVSYIRIPHGYLPNWLQGKFADNILQRLFPAFFMSGDIVVGPIPKNTPTSLIANINLDGANPIALGTVLLKVKSALARIEREHLDDAQSTALLTGLVPDLLKVSACPDFVINRGHVFGSTLDDGKKRALIEFLKTF
jgi:hypothetical protein